MKALYLFFLPLLLVIGGCSSDDDDKEFTYTPETLARTLWKGNWSIRSLPMRWYSSQLLLVLKPQDIHFLMMTPTTSKISDINSREE